MDFLSKEVNVSEVKVQVSGPSGPVKVDLDLGPRGGKGVFVPTQVGFYEVRESTKFLQFYHNHDHDRFNRRSIFA